MLRHFKCIGFKKDGTPCEKELTLPEDQGHGTECRCHRKYFYKNGNVVDENGNIVESW